LPALLAVRKRSRDRLNVFSCCCVCRCQLPSLAAWYFTSFLRKCWFHVFPRAKITWWPGNLGRSTVCLLNVVHIGVLLVLVVLILILKMSGPDNWPLWP
jgi:hypothetical protein